MRLPLLSTALAGALFLSLAGTGLAAPAATPEGYYRFPALHGDRLYFVAEEDLWVVDAAKGGAAQRLTSGTGAESFPIPSPDGQWLAFLGNYEGSADLYVIPAMGGRPTRLTYHPDTEVPVTWTPDSKNIIFRSRKDCPHGRSNRVYRIAVQGGNEELFVPYEVSRLAFIGGDANRFVFNRLDRDFHTWKRYKGGTAQDVWFADTKAKDFRKLTDFPGTDSYPMATAERVYFLSDRDGKLNIWSMKLDATDLTQHTRHDTFDARFPSINQQPSGATSITYGHGGDLYVLDVASNTTRKVPVSLPSDSTKRFPKMERGDMYLTDYDATPDGKRIIATVRGNLWSVPVEEGRTYPISLNSAQRDRYASVSPDGNWVATTNDASGSEELTLYPLRNNAPARQVTRDSRAFYYDPIWSPDGKWITTCDNNFVLWLVEVSTGKRTSVDHNRDWEIRNPKFSPDSRYIAYTKYYEDRMASVFVYDLTARKVHQVTPDLTEDFDVTWDPDGKWLAILSQRTVNPHLGNFDFEYILSRQTKPYLIPLKKDMDSPFLTKDPDEPSKKDEEDKGDEDKADKKDSGKKKKKDGDKDKEKEKPAEVKPISIDFDGIADRIIPVPTGAGNYYGILAGKDVLFYLSRPVRSMRPIWEEDDEEKFTSELVAYDIAEKKRVVIASDVTGYRMTENGEHLVVYSGSSIRVLPAKPQAAGEAKPVKFSDIVYPIDPAAEWKQIFSEAWRLQRDWYWDKEMTRVNWQAVYEQYLPLVERIGTRNELNDVIGQMIAELGTSHTYVWGGDFNWDSSGEAASLGIEVTPDVKAGAFKITRIHRPDQWEPSLKSSLYFSDSRVKVGDYVLAINGVRLDPSRNFSSYLIGAAGRELLVSTNSTAKLEGAKEHRVEALYGWDERQLIYTEWVRNNLEYVSKKTDGRIGYIHIPDMGTNGLIEFSERYYPQVAKDGLILDARFNGGGFVSQLLIKRLARQIYAWGTHRNGAVSTYPAAAPQGRLVVLTDCHAGSDGDIFPRSFQLLKLGKVVGTRPWGGVVGIRGDKMFVDFGMVTRPEFGWLDPHMGWGVENYGVDPDIVVDILPTDVLAGKDPQLDTGISVLLEDLKANPLVRQTRPALPDHRVEVWKERMQEWLTKP